MNLQGEMEMKDRHPPLVLISLRICAFQSKEHDTTKTTDRSIITAARSWAAELPQNLSQWQAENPRKGLCYEVISAQVRLLSPMNAAWAWITWSKEELEWADEFH